MRTEEYFDGAVLSTNGEAEVPAMIVPFGTGEMESEPILSGGNRIDVV